MNDKEEYTIDDVISAKDKRVVEIEWNDGVIPLRIEPITHGNLGALRRKVRKQSENFNWDLADEIAVHCTEKKNNDGDWEDLDKKEWKQLPPGLTQKIMDEVNQALGLGTTAEQMENLSPEMVSQNL